MWWAREKSENGYDVSAWVTGWRAPSTGSRKGEEAKKGWCVILLLHRNSQLSGIYCIFSLFSRALVINVFTAALWIPACTQIIKAYWMLAVSECDKLWKFLTLLWLGTARRNEIEANHNNKRTTKKISSEWCSRDFFHSLLHFKFHSISPALLRDLSHFNWNAFLKFSPSFTVKPPWSEIYGPLVRRVFGKGPNLGDYLP